MLRRRIDVRVEEAFGSTCSRCRRDAEFTRFTEVERFRLFNIRGFKTGLHSHRVRCGSCGHEQHVRDLETLDSPMLSKHYADALRAAIGALDLQVDDVEARAAAVGLVGEFVPAYDGAALDADRVVSDADVLAAPLTELRDTCHVSVHRHWLAAVIHVAQLSSRSTDVVERSAQLLALSDRDVARARDLLGGLERGEHS